MHDSIDDTKPSVAEFFGWMGSSELQPTICSHTAAEMSQSSRSPALIHHSSSLSPQWMHSGSERVQVLANEGTNFFPHLGQRNLCDKQLATNAPIMHPMKVACRANEIAWRFQESARVFRNESSTSPQTTASKAPMKNLQNIRRGA